MSNNLKKHFITVVSSIFIATSFILGGLPQTHLEAAAEKRITLELPTGDMDHRQEIHELPKQDIYIEKKSSNALLADNSLNQNVTVGDHYNALTSEEKAIYRAIVLAGGHVYSYDSVPTSSNSEGAICVATDRNQVISYTSDQMNNALHAAKYDHIDMVQLTLCSLWSYPAVIHEGGTTTNAYYLYLKCTEGNKYTQAQFESMNNSLRSARTTFLADPSITGARGKIGKELAIHDKLIKENTYDTVCRDNHMSYHLSHTAYGALVNKTSVCDGYAMAYSYLLDGAQIESRVVTGDTSSGLHAWNIVEQEGGWYEVDTTWDDQENIDGVSSLTEDDEKQIYHMFYHLTTAEISDCKLIVRLSRGMITSESTRSRDGFSPRLPIAYGTMYSYPNVAAYVENGTLPENIAVTGIRNNAPARIEVGKTVMFGYEVLPRNASNQNVIWTSSDSSVLLFSDMGVAYTIAPGKCRITVTSEDGGFSETTTITVYAPDNSLNQSDNTTYEDDNNANPGDANPAENAVIEDQYKNYPEDGTVISGNYLYIINNSGEAVVSRPEKSKLKKIKSVTISNSVEYNGTIFDITEIESGAYKNCKKLTSLSIGSNVRKIGGKAFYGCSSLKKITIKGNNLASVGSGSFKNIKKGVKITIICKDKSTYNKLVRMIKKAGAKKANFKYKKG